MEAKLSPARGTPRRRCCPHPVRGPRPTAPWWRTIFDILWSVASYERMVVDWALEPSDATRGITWVIGLLREAISAASDGLP